MSPHRFERVGNMLVVNQREVEVLKRIPVLRAEGWSLERIAAELNKDSIPAKMVGPWCLSSVRSVLRSTFD